MRNANNFQHQGTVTLQISMDIGCVM